MSFLFVPKTKTALNRKHFLFVEEVMKKLHSCINQCQTISYIIVLAMDGSYTAVYRQEMDFAVGYESQFILCNNSHFSCQPLKIISTPSILIEVEVA